MLCLIISADWSWLVTRTRHTGCGCASTIKLAWTPTFSLMCSLLILSQRNIWLTTEVCIYRRVIEPIPKEVEMFKNTQFIYTQGRVASLSVGMVNHESVERVLQLTKKSKFIILQTCFPPQGLLYHVSKICKNVLPRKVQDRKTAKFYGREYFMFYINQYLTHSWREPSGEMCTKGERHCAHISRKGGPPAWWACREWTLCWNCYVTITCFHGYTYFLLSNFNINIR